MKDKKLDQPEFEAQNASAIYSLIIPIVLAVTGVVLAYTAKTYLYWTGQLIVSLFFLQTFILLHECAHLNFFKTRILNVIFGHLFGFLSIIPFYSWQQMHNLHHRWTGWRDKDPTTETTITPSKSKGTNFIINLAWVLFIPLFFLSYKLSNYWNLFKIKRFVNPKKYKKVRFQIIVYLVAYTALGYFFWEFLIKFLVPAFAFSLVWKELVIMTQHSHVEMPISTNNEVKPFSYLEQVKYTRSFYLNVFISKYFLFNFNLHETHHAYPGIPAYKLSKIDINTTNNPKFLKWLYNAKSMKGVDYIFKTSKQTGKHI
jgi:fatty acid desaturase